MAAWKTTSLTSLPLQVDKALQAPKSCDGFIGDVGVCGRAQVHQVVAGTAGADVVLT